MSQLARDMHDKLNTLIHSMGYEFWGADVLPQGSMVLYRLYINHPTGVTADHCAAVSRQVAALFDVEEYVAGRYTLEVSSPGVNRPLYTPTQFQQYTGNDIVIRLSTAMLERRRMQGQLLSVDQEKDEITLRVETLGEVSIPFSRIEKANLVGEVSFKK